SAAGVYPSDGEISPFDFVERVRSAAAAGFNGISFWHADLAAVCETRPLSAVRRILDDHGIGAWEVAVIEDRFVEGDRQTASDKRRDFVLEAAATLGAHHVKAGDRCSTACDINCLPEYFRALCEAADRFDQDVGFEFMKVSMIHELADCLRMVEQAGAANGG